MKLSTLFFLFGSFLFISGCTITIPETDNTPPTFIFEITNGLPGGSIRITQEDDLSQKQLNLRRNTLYGFRYTGSDQGGLKDLLMLVDWPTDFLNLIPDGAVNKTTTGETSRQILWTGNRSDPKSGVVITGQIHTIMYNQSYAVVNMHWNFLASDYGGNSGSPNRSSNSLNIGVVDDTQELGWIEL